MGMGMDKEQILKLFMEWANSLGEMTSEEVASLIAENASYGFYVGITGFFCGIVCIYFIFKAVNKITSIYTQKKEFDMSEQKFQIICRVIAYFIIFVLILASYDSLAQTIKASVSPKIYFIEKITIRR